MWAGVLVLFEHGLAQPGERPVLGDPDGGGGGAHDLRGLFGAEPDGDAQYEDLALAGGQRVQQLAQSFTELRGEYLVLGFCRCLVPVWILSWWLGGAGGPVWSAAKVAVLVAGRWQWVMTGEWQWS